MDKATAAIQAAILLANVIGVGAAQIRSLFKSVGMTDEQINAAIDAVIADAQRRKAEADAAAGLPS